MNYLRKCRVSVGMSSGSSLIVEALEGVSASRRLGVWGDCHEVAKQIRPRL